MDDRPALRLPVLETDGSILMVDIPHLSEAAFEFLKTLLDRYKPAIVRERPLVDTKIEVGQVWRQKVAPEFEVTLIDVAIDRLRYQHEPSGGMALIALEDLLDNWELVDAAE